MLGWLILIDDEASADELEEADRLLGQELAGVLPVEQANQRLSLAFLRLRQGRETAPLVDEARGLLSAEPAPAARHQLVAAWADLIEALGRLAGGEATAAAEDCLALARRAPAPLLPQALSCAARALEASGRVDEAAGVYEELLARHSYRAGERLGVETIPQGPDQRAGDFLRAARLAALTSRPRDAWSYLAALDGLGAREVERRLCRAEASDPETIERWERIDAELASLSRQLADLEWPSSGRRRLDVEPLRGSLRQRLRDLWQRWPGCPPPLPPDDGGVVFRAFVHNDGVILLRRRGEDVVVEKRTALAEGETTASLDRTRALLESGRGDDDDWRRASRTLARALVPEDLSSLPPVTVYALHGALQGLPIGALPLPEGRGPRWLAEVTTVALSPVSAPVPILASPAGPPVIVVDPERNLPPAPRLEQLLRRRFPEAVWLRGEAARRGTLRSAAQRSEWLHVDAHGSYDPAFPDFSSIRLSDGALTVLELAEIHPPRRFANLSVCRAGSWPHTADRGHYGLGGVLARLGVPWVIASRSDLSHDLAVRYNSAFYAAVAAGGDAAMAHGAALGSLREAYPAARWSRLLLLRGPIARREGGNVAPAGLPDLGEGA